MKNKQSTSIPFFTPFDSIIDKQVLPTKFELMLNGRPHPICVMAVNELQKYLLNEKNWNHNFGLVDQKEGKIIGKMFGVLVVKTAQNEIGYLAAFSGKLAGTNHHIKFVPPVFDLLTPNSFLNNGMEELTRINNEIKKLEEVQPIEYKEQITKLKKLRMNNSAALQREIFENYNFLNGEGNEKTLLEIFRNAQKNPPSGAGECAAPKLLQYAFKKNLKPIALAEFWWGLSPKSAYWKHGHFYPTCREKCEPILSHMLVGINE